MTRFSQFCVLGLMGVSVAVLACGKPETVEAPAVEQARAALTIDVWTQNMEAAPTAPLAANDPSSHFTTVIGAVTSAASDHVLRSTGAAGAVVHAGAHGVVLRGASTAPTSGPAPTYANEVLQRVDTSGLESITLTYWRRLVGFESSLINGAVVTDRLVVRYSTAASPGPSDWTEAQVITNVEGGQWVQGTVSSLPASPTLWISFLADFKPRMNTAVTPNVYQFDEWAYLDDIVLTGDNGCDTDAECDDEIECTIDTCETASGDCVHAPEPIGESCNDRVGNLAGVCDGAGACVECTSAVQCSDDGNACTNGPVCSSNACSNGPLLACDDGAMCNGVETCAPTTGCVPGTPLTTDDGVACTIDSCHETFGVVNEPDDAACDDSNECTDDTCDVDLGCDSVITSGAPCSSGVCTASGSCVECIDNSDCALSEICSGNACTCAPGSCPACGPGQFNHMQRIEPIGAVSVLDRSGEYGAWFGSWLSISGDRMVVGAPNDAEAAAEAGAAFVFELQNGSWVQTTKLMASDADEEPLDENLYGPGFGWNVAIDGDTIAVGALSADGVLPSETEIGAVYVYELHEGEWIETRLDSAPLPGQYFGSHIALDGDWLMATRDHYTETTIESTPYVITHSVEVWHRVAPHIWEMTQTLHAEEVPSGQTSLGAAIAIDGNRAILNAKLFYTHVSAGGLSSLGLHDYVHSFVLSGTTWTLEEIIEAPPDWPVWPNSLDAGFGWDLDLDGTTAIIGEPWRIRDPDEEGLGITHVAELPFGTSSLVDIPVSPLVDDLFGWSVSRDANVLAISNFPWDAPASIEVYARGTSWTHVDSIPAPAAGEDFGFVIRLEEGQLAAGARFAEAPGYTVPPGVVYAFSCSEGGGNRCDSDADCDDGVECTTDRCETGGCTYTPLEVGESCNDRGGSLSGVCDGAGACVECTSAVQCSDDGDACTDGPVCSSNTCSNGPLLACDDGAMCNGIETCAPATGCVPGTPLATDDGIACTIDSCHETFGVVNEPDDAACDDGNECTTDTCDVELGCGSVITAGAPCSSGVCTASGSCVECTDDSHCALSEVCSDNACTCAPGSCPACGPGQFNHVQRIEPVGAVSVLDRFGNYGAAFGWHFSISGDRMVVGAQNDAEAAAEAGAAFVFELQNGSWVQTTKLMASDTMDEPIDENLFGPGFGWKVAIDGDTIAVGAPGADGGLPSETEIGAVYVYELHAGEWVETRLDSAPVPGQYLGEYIALDGDWLMATRNHYADTSWYTMSVEVWHRVAPHTWEMTQTLHAEETPSGQTSLGGAIAIDGNRALIPAREFWPYYSAHGLDDSVQSFLLSGTTWTLEEVIESPPTDPPGGPGRVGSLFGWDIDLDGTTAFIGAPAKPGDNDEHHSGKTYVVELPLGTSSLAEIPHTPLVDVRFGHSVSHDADVVAISHHPWYEQESIQTFVQDGGWTKVSSISPPAAGENFGDLVRLENGHLLVGARFAEAPGYSVPPGVVYAFSCSEGGTGCTPSGDDDTCNNVDEDCDGNTDEGYDGGSSGSCGEGVCERAGVNTCVGGTPTVSCQPGTPTGSDNNCNGSDEDCDGTVDEGCHCHAVTATAAEHTTASRAFLCSSTPATTIFSEGFESGAIGSAWTTTGNYSASSVTAQSGTYSAQAQGTGLSTMRRTVSTAGFTSRSLTFSVRTREPMSAGYMPAVRYSTNGGSSWSTIASHPGYLPAWSTITSPALPAAPEVLLSFEATPTETTRFVHYDSIALTGSCSTSTYMASGTNAVLGTSGSQSVMLHNLATEPGVWRTGVCPPPPGCSPQGPCGVGDGPCDVDADCAAGLSCGRGLGSRYGLPAHEGVCWDPGTCADLDPSECGIPDAPCGETCCVPDCEIAGEPDGCGGICQSCVPWADTDGDGLSDCDEMEDDDDWTNPAVLNGVRATQGDSCHAAPTCAQIDSRAEVTA